MAIRGVSLTITYTAWNTQTQAPETGDVANHTLRLCRDGAESTPANSPSEVDSTNLKGEYKLTLTAAEMTCDFITIGGVSSTSNVIIAPVKITTEHGVCGTVPQGQAGALLTSGTGVGQLNVNNGVGDANLAEYLASPCPAGVVPGVPVVDVYYNRGVSVFLVGAIPVNITQVNGHTVKGSGKVGDEWGPA